MRKMKKTFFAIMMSVLLVTQSFPVYATEGIADEMTEAISEEETEEVVSDFEEISEEESVSDSEETSETASETEDNYGESEPVENSEEEEFEDVSDEAEESSFEEASEENVEETSEASNQEVVVCESAVRPDDGEERINIQEIDTSIKNGNIAVELKGTYHTETADKILTRLNEIRKEACDNGYIDPYTGKALKASDYKPLKWSADMEAIARVRAAEGAVYMSNTRPNGETCWTVTTKEGVQSSAENLDSNYDGLMKGIETWYGGKNDYLDKKASKAANCYKSIISTKFNQVGVSCFYSKEKNVGYPYTVAMELSHLTNLDTTKDKTQGSRTVAIEYKGDYVKSIGIANEDLPFLIVGENGVVVCKATVSYKCPKETNITRTLTSAVNTGLTWESSDESVASINSSGRVTAKKVGKTTISASFGSYCYKKELEVFPEGTSPLIIENLSKTTYLVGEKMDVKNATVRNRRNKKSAKLTADEVKITGFSTEKAGKIAVKVAFDGESVTFDILVLDLPKLNAVYGNTLASLPMPGNSYGTFDWVDSKDTVLSKVGENRYKMIFTPLDTVAFQIRKDIEAYVYVYRELEATWVSFPEKEYPYTGGYQQPRPIVVSDGDLVTLQNGTDYEILTYSNNKHIGVADIILKGKGYYTGTVTAHFTISNGEVVITAKDVVLCVDDPIPTKFEYTCTGLAEGDTLLTPPTLSCSIESTEKTGLYQIVPSGAVAGENYDITYIPGELRVVKAPVYHDVTFDTCGIGIVPLPLIGVPTGETIEAPSLPQIEGYLFDGWYKDITYKTAWDFEKDTVSANITLYAKWLKKRSETTFYVQQIPDMTYTSKALKPVVTVYDGERLLKAGKDYSVSYKNNTNVNVGNKKASDTFDSALPYVTITGKGNYTDKISVNFNILPVSIGNEEPAEKVTFKYQNQIVKSTSKAQSVFSSLKAVATLKSGKDFTLTLTTLRAYNEKGALVAEGTECLDAKVPKGYSGSFILTVKGIGNYTGLIKQEIKVATKQTLLKNATVTIGASVKSQVYNDNEIRLTPAVYDAKEKCYYRVINGGLEAPITGKKEVVDPKEVYLVKLGDNYLIQDKDFTVTYENNNAVGTATLTIQGKGDYSGMKTASFQITGNSFNTKDITIKGIGDVDYTGSAATFSYKDVKVVYKEGTTQARELKWGQDFTVKYAKNINKGTATVTFTGLAEGGFTGKITKKFKINAIDIADETKVIRSASMKEIKMVYDKAGVKPEEQIVLKSASGKQLKLGVDYTVSYKNNKKPATAYEEKAPSFTVKGKGNYKGSFTVKFTILAGVLEDDDISVVISPIAFSAKKKDMYIYKPKVTVYDGKKTMKAKSDYTVEYINATQDKVALYLEKVASDTVMPEDIPLVRITAGSNGLYEGSKEDILLPVYEKKIEAKYLYVLVDESEAVYTGDCVQPSVRVFYSANTADVKRAKKTKNVEQILAYGLKEWTEGEEYELSYGTNTTAGKNKGSVVITGVTPDWGGKLTQKFTVTKKSIE